MSEIRIVVPGNPVGKGRPRAYQTRGPRRTIKMHTPEKTRDAERVVKEIARSAMGGMPPIEGPVSVQMTISHEARKSWSKAKRNAALLGEIAPTIKSDIDNVIKLYFDAMNGVVWHDDVQVVEVRARKTFAEHPFVIVTVTPIKAKPQEGEHCGEIQGMLSA